MRQQVRWVGDRYVVAHLGWSHGRLCLGILAGDMDSFIPIQKLHELTRRMEPPPEVHVLHGGDHFLAAYESEIAERVGGFFAGVLLNRSASKCLEPSRELTSPRASCRRKRR